MKQALSISSAKNPLLSPFFRPPHQAGVRKRGLFFRLRMVRGRLCHFHDRSSQGVVHLEKSLMPNLLMHQADAYVPRFKVENTPTPSSTQSWRPIPHTRLLETVEANLKDKGFLITSQSHGLTHNHNRYFGLLEIRSPDEAEDYRSIIGVRNSHDKTFPAGVVLGRGVKKLE